MTSLRSYVGSVACFTRTCRILQDPVQGPMGSYTGNNVGSKRKIVGSSKGSCKDFLPGKVGVRTTLKIPCEALLLNKLISTIIMLASINL